MEETGRLTVLEKVFRAEGHDEGLAFLACEGPVPGALPSKPGQGMVAGGPPGEDFIQSGGKQVKGKQVPFLNIWFSQTLCGFSVSDGRDWGEPGAKETGVATVGMQDQDENGLLLGKDFEVGNLFQPLLKNLCRSRNERVML